MRRACAGPATCSASSTATCAVIGADLADGRPARASTGCSRSGGELVTLVTGAGAPDGLGRRASEHTCGATGPTSRPVVYDGGQPRYPLLIGVE